MVAVRAWYRSFWIDGKFGISPGTLEAYLAAAILVAAASLIRWALGFLGAVLLPFTTYFPAVLFATYLGGLRVGIFAAILGGLIGWGAFMPSHFAFFALTREHQLELATYVFACILIVWSANSYRRLADRLQDEERLRKLAVARCRKLQRKYLGRFEMGSAIPS
jgi:K+-sensing histidine kinase KdpD